ERRQRSNHAHRRKIMVSASRPSLLTVLFALLGCTHNVDVRPSVPPDDGATATAWVEYKEALAHRRELAAELIRAVGPAGPVTVEGRELEAALQEASGSSIPASAPQDVAEVVKLEERQLTLESAINKSLAASPRGSTRSEAFRSLAD